LQLEKLSYNQLLTEKLVCTEKNLVPTNIRKKAYS